MDRNVNADRRGKYALIKLRNYPPATRAIERGRVDMALAILQDFGMLDYGYVGTEGEFMVIRLKDAYAGEALEAYTNEAGKVDPEYADEIREMADRSGPNNQWCKTPD